MIGSFSKIFPAASSSLNKITFPNVRKVFGSMIAQEIVNVQPMAIPSGLQFYMDFTFGLRRPCRDAREFRILFAMAERFTQRFPVGTIVTHKDVSGESKMRITSEGFPLTNFNAVGFTTDASTNENKFWYFDEFVEWSDFRKEFDDEPGRDEEI